ncbi:MAG: 6-phosphogluconate dehydrogenase [Alphaproteobacteria bacterium]|nr:MAG: 6-phosphogluconate dehydrogenase [Alphaproteobacteria bacterium]
MENNATFIGFGEAAQAFCGTQKGVAAWKAGSCSAFDLKTQNTVTASQKWNEYSTHGIQGTNSLEEALGCSQNIFSLVTADQALISARNASAFLKPGALYFDMNSVAPATKISAAKLIEASGGRYVDVAVMAPVYPARLCVPLLVSGPHSNEATNALHRTGFTNIKQSGSEIGRASSIKMIRSVMIKGIEALTAECVFAAEKAGVLPEVLSALGEEWAEKANYNFDRMMVHGARRAAEMREVCKTLENLGVEPLLSIGTVQRQDSIGKFGLISPLQGLENKLTQITNVKAG